jgi:homoaconitase/3-isopropylmalate dehydratase large subunit
VPAAAPSKDASSQRRRHAQAGSDAKDIILALLAKIGVGGGTGCVFEYQRIGDSARSPWSSA